MNSLQIKVEIEGQPVAFRYEHQKSKWGEWYASIVDEYMTIAENFSGMSSEACLDGAIKFIVDLGVVTDVSSFEPGNPYLATVRRRIEKAYKLRPSN